MSTRNCFFSFAGNPLFSHNQREQLPHRGRLIFERNFKSRRLQMQRRSQPCALGWKQTNRIFFRGDAGSCRVHLRKLQDALIANKNAVGKTTLFERTDVDFHYVLAQIPRNPIFLAMHDAVFEWLYEQRRITLSIANQVENACREHEEIFNAICDRDPGRAERAMRAHLTRGHELYWASMQRGTVESES